MFDKLEKGGLIRCLPYKTPGELFSYKLCRLLPDISLTGMFEVTDKLLYCTMPTPEEFYIRPSQTANRIGVLNEETFTFQAEVKIVDW